MPLTDAVIRSAKPGDRPVKQYAGRGLLLILTPSGARWWRFKYRFAGKEKMLSLGVYPDISLKKARDKCEEARQLLAAKIDPAEQRRVRKVAGEERAANSFETVAREWFERNKATWATNHSDKIIRRLERDIFPRIGKRPISGITAPELLSALKRIESRKAYETAHRALANCGQVFRYAITTSRATSDPTRDLRGALTPTQEKHHASITDPAGVGQLLRAVIGYQGSEVTRFALHLAPLVFVRPGELRKAEWNEFNLDGAEWRIPAERMKMGQQHIVPLSRQAVAILRELFELTGKGRYVLPGARTNGRPMSENTVNAALRRLGYGSDDMTGHGFRSMASTLLNERGWNRNAIERQLAHAERDNVRAAYNYAEHLPERRKMMQAWADYLDTLRDGAEVVSIRAA